MGVQEWPSNTAMQIRLYPALGDKEWGVESCMAVGHCTAAKTEKIDVVCKARVNSEIQLLESKIAALQGDVAALATLEAELEQLKGQMQSHLNATSHKEQMMQELDAASMKMKDADKDFYEEVEHVKKKDEMILENKQFLQYALIGVFCLLVVVVAAWITWCLCMKRRSSTDTANLVVVSVETPPVDGSIAVVGRAVRMGSIQPKEGADDIAGGYVGKSIDKNTDAGTILKKTTTSTEPEKEKKQGSLRTAAVAKNLDMDLENGAAAPIRARHSQLVSAMNQEVMSEASFEDEIEVREDLCTISEEASKGQKKRSTRSQRKASLRKSTNEAGASSEVVKRPSNRVPKKRADRRNTETPGTSRTQQPAGADRQRHSAFS